MAETVRSLFDYREPLSLDSDGDGIKPAPPLRRGCGRKRKGTPVKVFLTHTEEESLPEHSSFPPSPNCRIREVHCGSQVRLVVIAIRDITRGEEITVDYSLTEWGENMQGFRGTVSPAQHDCNSDAEMGNNIKKEDEPLPLTAQQQQRQRQHQRQQQQEYVTPSWSLSPSSSPISHSDASDSDAGDEDNASPRGRTPRRRKKRRGTPSKKKTPHRTPPGRPMPVSSASTPHPNRPLPSSHPPSQSSPPCTSSSFSSAAKPVFKAPAGSGRHHLLPLLSSLSSLVLYLRRLQHSAFLSLSRQLQSAEAWRLLCHSSLALLILYNRRRECEVSKLSIAEYRARVTPQCPVPVPPGAPPALTPLEASLSPFERLVLPHLPRVGVQGKRGRVQPLILPPHCEPCLELLLQTRQDVGVDPANPYVFARPYHSPATPLRGTDLLRSLARSSGTRNPRALTQTRVRRQVAILTQLLLLGEGEDPGQPGGNAVERLEHFLEREYHVTQNCAGIGQDPGLMGRVGRVVLCGERDGVLFRGMSLNHICLELDMSGNSADSYSEGESDGEQVKEKPDLAAPAPAPTPKRGVLKRPWSEAERAAVEEHLTQNITELRVPAKADCERCLQQCPLLVSNHRDWRAIKFYCHNRIQLLKKNQRRDSDPLPLAVC
uniref:Si:dkey-117m1.4 n=1 Tax=Labrus bergylta TaxID=56723 RepID=A0A3Q3LQ65_9LABR